MLFSPANVNITRKTITFTGASGLGLAGTNVTVFTVTGLITVKKIVARCTTNLGEAAPTATVSLGTTATVALFIAATNSVDIDTPDIWTAISPTLRSILIPTIMKDTLVNGENIIIACATQNTNSGVLDVTLTWEPETAGASAV